MRNSADLPSSRRASTMCQTSSVFIADTTYLRSERDFSVSRFRASAGRSSRMRAAVVLACCRVRDGAVAPAAVRHPRPPELRRAPTVPAAAAAAPPHRRSRLVEGARCARTTRSTSSSARPRCPTSPTTRRAVGRCSTKRTRDRAGRVRRRVDVRGSRRRLTPTSVEAHHLRGAALAALGRDAEAQVAYSLALALDPDDPETLRAVADFYINGKGERGRDALRLGLELAQRGSRRAQARRRRNAPLAADLAVLEAQALNDLGRSDEALARVDAALRFAPGRGDALHEKGVALFDLSRFADAQGRVREGARDPARRRVHAPDARAHARAARRDRRRPMPSCARASSSRPPSCRRRC